MICFYHKNESCGIQIRVAGTSNSFGNWVESCAGDIFFIFLPKEGIFVPLGLDQGYGRKLTSMLGVFFTVSNCIKDNQRRGPQNMPCTFVNLKALIRKKIVEFTMYSMD